MQLCIRAIAAAIVSSMGQAVEDRIWAAIARSPRVFGDIPEQLAPENYLTAGLAHDVRNSLASIRGVADAFLQRRQLTTQEREWMEAVRREVLKIDARMRELLNVSQPQPLNLKQCSLNDLLSHVVLLATHQVNDRRGQRISIQFMDETTEPVVMSLDSDRIEDAVLNLVLNAIESIDGNGQVTVRLRRRGINGDGAAIVEVSDTGCGISLDIRRKIFEPRFTTKCEGSGLGLAVVRETAAAHQGRITFKSRIGRGSKFVLALPLQRLTENTK